MQRLLGIAVVVASGLMKLSIAAGPADEVIEGRIAAASRSSITIVDKQGENLLVLLAADCKVVRDGKPSEPMMLGVGERVRVTTSDIGGKLTASHVEAFSVQRSLRPVDRTSCAGRRR